MKTDKNKPTATERMGIVRFMLLSARPALNIITADRIQKRWAFDNSIDVGCGKWLPVGYVLGSTLVDFPEHDAHDLNYFETDEFDLVVCCNVLEHLHDYPQALKQFRRIGKKLYLGWTPWFSPWGKHRFGNKGSFRLGHNLFKTYVDEVVRDVEAAGWKVIDVRPRYWPFMKFFAWLPGRLKDFFCWNVEVWAERKEQI